MGQAKLRGTYEQRKAQGEAKAFERELARLEAQRERDRIERERIAALTPAQRKKERDHMMSLATILQMSRAGMNGVKVAGIEAADVLDTMTTDMMAYPSEEEITGRVRIVE